MTTNLIRVSIVGATGYTGIELVRILGEHPNVTLSHLVSENHQSQDVFHVFPHLTNTINVTTFSKLDVELIAENSDLVFLALPHTAAAPLAQKFLDLKVKVIDLSADLRLHDGEVYHKWYQHQAASQKLLEMAVYGLPEIGRRKLIEEANLIANPGCYPTASILGAAPLLKHKLLDLNHTIILDAKSGVSGSGRSLNLVSAFCEVTNSFSAYQIAGIHRHIPEIEQELSLLAGKSMTICFTPHLVPMPRGLMVTAYYKLNNQTKLAEIVEFYKNYYQDSLFVRVNTNPSRPTTKAVLGSNYCDINLNLDKRTGHLVVVSTIDNLIKGASGQAVQNMNIMYKLAEQTGLEHIPIYP